MKAISLWQPWASLIACGAKDIETRSWRAPASLIGQRVLIHAAKTRKGIDLLAKDDLTDIAIRSQLEMADYPSPESLPLGALVASAIIDCVVPIEELEPDPFGDFTPGRFGWRLSGVRSLPPTPWKGHQGFFDVDTSALGLLPSGYSLEAGQ